MRMRRSVGGHGDHFLGNANSSLVGSGKYY